MKKWRKWFRATHRDLGYIFFALTVIYGVSGIAVNHIRDWNPNYIITNNEFTTNLILDADNISEEKVLKLLTDLGEQDKLKKYYFPTESDLKIFLKGGSIVLNTETGEGNIEKIRKRPVFFQMNYLHYNPVKLWTIISDIYAGGIIILAITGLFLIRGKNGIKRRGAWLTIFGILIPVLFLLLYS